MQLVLLPGLAADSRMFYPQVDLGCPVVLPKVPAPRRGESLGDLADRIETPAGDILLGGVSMGGMLALELARRRSCRGVILIASSRDARLVPPLLKWMAGFLRVAPDLGRRARLPAWRSLVRRLGCLSPADQDILAQALSSFPLDHIREYARMVVEWKGVPEAGVPTTHVHGDRDLVIPIRYVRPDAIVKGGGHALNMTHPEAVN